MEMREDLLSILPLLPLEIRYSNLCWPVHSLDILCFISRGPGSSKINTGELLFSAISSIRESWTQDSLHPLAAEGYSLLFDQLMPRMESAQWFCETVPLLASLLLRLPSLLEAHYLDSCIPVIRGTDLKKTGLRLLNQQEAGMVFLSQEEIRFMINPECIVGMLFLPCMKDNEAVEIVGAERYSNYTGYASTFCFLGDHIDKRNIDSFGRRNSRIVAIDALPNPRARQYLVKYILRDINKAFCGFLDHSVIDDYSRRVFQNQECMDIVPRNNFLDNAVGIATGNWGCGAFGGDPELKVFIQWLAASQALRPFISYYTLGAEALANLDQFSWLLFPVGLATRAWVDYR